MVLKLEEGEGEGSGVQMRYEDFEDESEGGMVEAYSRAVGERVRDKLGAREAGVVDFVVCLAPFFLALYWVMKVARRGAVVKRLSVR